jgi:hypothetical protein
MKLSKGLVALIVIGLFIIIWAIIEFMPQSGRVNVNFRGGTGKKMDLVGSTTVWVDGEEVLFLGGGPGAPDRLFRHDKVTNVIAPFMDIEKKDDAYTTCAAAAVFVDGKEESIVVGRSDGIYILNREGGGWNSELIKTLDKVQLPTSISIADFDRSGTFSIFVTCHNNPEHLQALKFEEHGTGKNMMLVKQNPLDDTDGDGTGDGNRGYIDVAPELGIAGTRNSWAGMLIDLTGDGFADIVVANDEGYVNIYSNRGSAESKRWDFRSVLIPKVQGFWMGIAAGDIDGSGNQSLFFSNMGDDSLTMHTIKQIGIVPSMPEDFSTKHMVLINRGNYKFDERLLRVGDPGATDFGWGPALVDTTLSGDLDLFLSTGWKMLPWNKVKPMRSPSVVVEDFKLINRRNIQSGIDELGFVVDIGGVRTNKYKNKEYGQMPIMWDFDKNGIKDIVWVNNSNSNTSAYKISPPIGNKYLNIQIPRTPRNSNARVSIIVRGKLITKQLIIGSGLGGCQSNILQFGLGTESVVDIVHVRTQELIMKKTDVVGNTTLISA